MEREVVGGGGESPTKPPHSGDTIDQLIDHASLVASFAAQFGSKAAAMKSRSEELRLAEEKVAEAMKELARKEEELKKEAEAVKRKSSLVDKKESAFELLMKKEIAVRRKHEEEIAAEKAAADAKLKELGDREEDFEALGSYIEERAIRVRELEEEAEEKRKELEAKEKEIELERAAFDEQSAEFQVRFTELRVKERGIEEKERQCRALESNTQQSFDELRLRVREFEQSVEEFHRKEEKIVEREKRCKELECKVEQSFKELKLREKGFRDRFVEFKAKQVRFEQSLRELKEKEGEIEEKEGGFEERLKDIKVREEGLEKKLEEFKAKEVRFGKDVTRLGLKEREIGEKELRSKELELKVQQCLDDLKLKENKLLKQLEELKEETVKFDALSSGLKVKEKEIVERDKVSRKKELEVRQCYDVLESREKRFNQKSEEFKARTARFERRLYELTAKEREMEKKEKQHKELEQWSRESKMKGRETEAKEKQLKELESKVQDCKKRLSRFQVVDSSLKLREEKLELKEKQLEERYKEFDTEGKKLADRMKDVELKMKQVESRCGESELKDRKLAKSLSVGVKLEPLDSSMCTMDHSSEANISFCVVMNGRDLQIFLNERCKDHDSMKDEVQTALRLSSDPAKLVLDAMQGFYPPHLKKGGAEFDEAVVKSSCILLLEQLTKMSPEIKPTTRNEAMKLAFDWMTRLKCDAEHALDIMAFLQLLAAYGLASAFDDDELAIQLGVVANFSQAHTLLQDLGLAGKISSKFAMTLPKDNQAPNLASSLEDKQPAPSNPASISSLNALNILSDSRTLSGAKRSRSNACADDNHTQSPGSAAVTSVSLPTQQPERLNAPAQQSERLSIDQASCSDPSPIKTEQSGASNINVSLPSKSLFVPECLEGSTRLRLLFRRLEKKSLYCKEVYDTLELASDHGEFVLGVIKNPSSLILKKGNEAVGLANPLHGPLLLLEFMRKMSTRVKPEAKRKALSFARDWRSELAKQIKDNLEAVCFLLFLAVYKLVSHFNHEELFSVFGKGNWPLNVTKLFRILGLKNLIPKFLEYLMRNKRTRVALSCINASSLLEKAPSTTKISLNKYFHKSPKESLGTETIGQQIEAINRELDIWKAVVQPISDQGLAESIRAHISDLEKQREEKLHPNTNGTPSSRPPRELKLPRQQEQQDNPAPVSSEPTLVDPSAKTNAAASSATSMSSTSPQDESSAPKRRRVAVSWNEPESPPVPTQEFIRGPFIPPVPADPYPQVPPPPPPPPHYGFPGYPPFGSHSYPMFAGPYYQQHNPYGYPGHGRSVPY
ncbi:unnamed protein product [Linum tenue]|uniref:FRIGIDA-like protein n=1 Tax=Linum tenue TaxID=586396 RepID=A0AAV0LCT1_9ROSI|nr:unnamed protein product [Linum tenue]